MPDYNLDDIISSGDDLIEIGFAVEGYEVENIRGQASQGPLSGTMGGDNASSIITVTPGGFINDEKAKQQVLNFSITNGFPVSNAEGEYTIVKNGEVNALSLPNCLNEEEINSKGIALSKMSGDSSNPRKEFYIGVALPASNVESYITNFYQNIKVPDLGQKLISSGVLSAQLSFCQGGSGVSLDAKVVNFCASGLTDTIQIDANIILASSLKSNFTVIASDSSKDYKVDGTQLKPFEYSGNYDPIKASIDGLDVDTLLALSKKPQMLGGQIFKKASVTSIYGTTVRCRLYIEESYKDFAQQNVFKGTEIPEGLIGRPMPYYAEVVSTPTGGSVGMGCIGMADAAEKWHNIIVNNGSGMRYSNDGYRAIPNTNNVSYPKADGGSYTPNYISSNNTVDCSGLVSLMLMDAGVMANFVKANSTGFCSKGFGGIEKNLKPGYQIKEIPISQVQKGDIIASTGTQAGGANNLSPQLGINTHRTDGAGNGRGGSKYGHVAVYYGGGRVTGIGGTKQKALDGNFNERTYRIALRIIQTS